MSGKPETPALRAPPGERRFLEVRDLSASFGRGAREVRAVKNVSFHIERGETFALVGESGSGKSVSALSILQLLPYPLAWHPSGSVIVDGSEMIGAPQPTLRTIRGDRISMIFQEPMTSLNPLHTVEKTGQRDPIPAQGPGAPSGAGAHDRAAQARRPAGCYEAA